MFLRWVIQATDSTLTGWNREKRRRQPRARNLQAQENAPQEERVAHMQQDAVQMIAQRIRSPKPPFQPEAGDGGGNKVIGRAVKPGMVPAASLTDQDYPKVSSRHPR